MALMLNGCGTDVSYVDVSERLVVLIDEAMSVGFQDEDLPDRPRVTNDACKDSFGAPSDEVRPVYTYRVPLSLLEIEPAAFASQVTDYWAAQGLTITEQDTEQAANRFATSEDGYSLQVLVNYVDSRLVLGGSGPCAPPSRGG